MKKSILEFIRRGLSACCLGPIVLAVIYLMAHRLGSLQMLTVREVCLGIFSLSALAFLAGGMNVVYQIERLPLMAAVALHGAVLYVGYLATYLVNGWLEWGMAAMLVFTGIFVGGYLAIWAVIYSVIRKKTQQINEVLKRKQLNTEER